MNRFFSALCVVCQAADKGETISQELEDSIRVVRMPDGVQIPLGAIKFKPIPDPLVGLEPDVGKVNYFYKVVSKVASVIKALGSLEPESKKLAKQKRKPRPLEGGLMINLDREESDDKS